MARAGRLAVRFLLAGALAGGAYFAWLSAVGSPAPVALLPPGAAVVIEARGAEGLAQRISESRLSAFLARSATREWLEQTAAVRAYDALLAQIEAVSGLSPGRRIAFDLVGEEAVVGWYPATDGAAIPGSWLAGGRLSARAWAVVTAMRIARQAGLGTTTGTREIVGGRSIYSFPGGAGQSLHLFLAGRVLVASPDRPLALKAARAAAERSLSLTSEPAWQAVRGALPARGELLVWVRDQGLFPIGATAGRASVAALVRAGKTLEIDVAAAPARRSGVSPSATSEPLPGTGLLRQPHLFFFSSREPVPPALGDLLQHRRRETARQGTNASARFGEIATGRGYALVITDGTVGSGLFPAPQVGVVIGMASAAAAAGALPQLFPPGARTSVAGATLARGTRESFPLAGEFELWGAAIGSRLVFATDTGIIAALVADADPEEPAASAPAWPVDAVARLSMEKALPLLRRWSAPLSGLLAANWPAAPDLIRDLDLLAAVRTVRVAAGSDGRHDRAAITLDLRDLP